MKLKKRYTIPIVLLILSIIIINSLGQFIPSLFVYINDEVLAKKSLKISKDIFYRQTYNNCAPYSVMAVINILKNEKADPELLAKETPFRIRKNLTYPLGVSKQLRKNKIKAKKYVLWHLSDKKKILWLKTQIDLGKPVILLIKLKCGVRHYFTVLGYDEKGFMIYDSYQAKSKRNPRKTIDDNINLAGNKYLKYEELLKLWNNAGYKIFFNNWAVSASLE